MFYSQLTGGGKTAPKGIIHTSRLITPHAPKIHAKVYYSQHEMFWGEQGKCKLYRCQDESEMGSKNMIRRWNQREGFLLRAGVCMI